MAAADTHNFEQTSGFLAKTQKWSSGPDTQVVWQPAGAQLRNLRLTLDGTERHPVAAAQHRRTALPPRYTICAHCGTLFALLIGILPLAYCYGHPLMGILSLLACIPPLLSLFSAFRPLVTVSSLYPHSSTTIILKAGILLLYL